MLKDVGAYLTRSSVWVSSVLFRRHVWRRPVDIIDFLSSPYMRRHILIHLEWRVATDGCRIAIDSRLIYFSFFSLSWHVRYTIVLFISYFSISVFILLISYFVPFSFIEFFIIFNLVFQLQFLICLIFHFDPHFSKFLILSLALFLKFFFPFNSIIKTKFVLV
jgi:hypothetical protein